MKEVDVHPLDQDQRAKVPEGANKTTFTIEDDVKNLSFVISGQITPKVKKKKIYIYLIQLSHSVTNARLQTHSAGKHI